MTYPKDEHAACSFLLSTVVHWSAFTWTTASSQVCSCWLSQEAVLQLNFSAGKFKSPLVARITISWNVKPPPDLVVNKWKQQNTCHNYEVHAAQVCPEVLFSQTKANEKQTKLRTHLLVEMRLQRERVAAKPGCHSNRNQTNSSFCKIDATLSWWLWPEKNLARRREGSKMNLRYQKWSYLYPRPSG